LSGGESRGAATQLERYLHEHIPITVALGISVIAAARDQVRLAAPLQPNINHRSTVFGGSAAATAILAGWALLHLRLSLGEGGSRIVIQRSTIDFELPITGDFEAVALPPRVTDWERFQKSLERRGLGRIDVGIELRLDGRRAGRCTGTYVVLPPERTRGAG
jgi:thioesterase domain-containing protein